MEEYFHPICGSSLWVSERMFKLITSLSFRSNAFFFSKDSNAIYSKTPDFTFCFQYTLLIWTPCLLLWFAAPVWVFKLTKRNFFRLPISWLFVGKITSIILLILIELINLGLAFENSSNVAHYMTPVLLISTYVTF